MLASSVNAVLKGIIQTWRLGPALCLRRQAVSLLFLTAGTGTATTNPRDLVYAIRALSPILQAKRLDPDYDLPLADLWTRVAMCLLDDIPGASMSAAVVLGLAAVQDHPLAQGLPSWVPDIEASTPESVRKYLYYANESGLQCAGGRSAQLDYVFHGEKPGVLHIQGAMFSDVAEILAESQRRSLGYTINAITAADRKREMRNQLVPWYMECHGFAFARPTAHPDLAQTFGQLLVHGRTLTGWYEARGPEFETDCARMVARNLMTFKLNSGEEQFVLKEMSVDDYHYYEDMYRDLVGSRYIRLLHDTVPQGSMFVFRYYPEHLLRAVREGLSVECAKQILRDTLRGIAELHAKDIVHTDVKPNNVLLERGTDGSGVTVKLYDIEDASYVPVGKTIIGKQVGNQMWRSPEGHARGPVNKPSDIFSFGITCIYAVLGKIIFAVEPEELDADLEPSAIILERQVSYFADDAGFDGLLKHLGDSPWCEILRVIRNSFTAEDPRRPFALWKRVDPTFKDFVGGLMNLDPAKRMTAEEALAHEWFDDTKD
ncbi:hypothetical protein LTR85_002003 [Meristemomyces frigidus]|nr:hypothetical protein LTR85_002003 [Meristemomyces frigidus]